MSKELRLAIISDTHFGDPESVLVTKNKKTKKIEFNEHFYKQFKDAAKKDDKKNTFLILLGDIFDCAIIRYEETFEIAKEFFKRIKKDNICDTIVYVPGNHDFELWHIIEYEVNIINRLLNGELPKGFKWSVPLIIDDRVGDNGKYKGKFWLKDVRVDKSKPFKYGGLYLDYITGKAPADQSNFILAYPNIYMTTEKEDVFITHGQYFKVPWSLLGELALTIFKEDLVIKDKIHREYKLKECVATNFLFSQLTSSGTGQSGPLSERIRFIQRTAKDAALGNYTNMDKIKKYLDNLDEFVDELTPHKFPLHPEEAITDSLSNWGKKKIYKKIKKYKPDRFNKEWSFSPKVIELMQKYYEYSKNEIDEINKKVKTRNEKIPIPKKLIFGHTHCPIPWGANDKNNFDTLLGETINYYNTGGWLYKTDKKGDKLFFGAEVITYSSSDGFNSSPIK